MAAPSSIDFARNLIRAGDSILIKSTCKRCGESDVVSVMDGSLQIWETGHACAGQKKDVQSARPAAARQTRTS